jgi:hypothetical protein
MPASETTSLGGFGGLQGAVSLLPCRGQAACPGGEMSCMESHLVDVLGARRAQAVRIRVC